MTSSVSRFMFLITVGVLFAGVVTFPTTTGSTTTTTGPPTTQGPPTTTPECTEGTVMNCMSYTCIMGRLEPFEFTATPECCEQQQQQDGHMHPRCYVI